ncbi:MAG: hypothetical protein KKE17_01330 [Proteobacteria bacterium]|nr:hypothetical protein [Pseudomonadota bacterium]MBU1708623.1 hypothetical protein [Pseudomonadota bacterium]
MEAPKKQSDKEKEVIKIEDNVYDQLFDKALDVKAIDNLYDELFGISSGNAGSLAVLEYLDGRREDISMAVLFHPTRNDITVMAVGVNPERILSLNDLSCIRIANMPKEFPELSDACQIDVIETVSGSKYQEYVAADQNMETGFFGFAAEEETKCKYSFFPAINMRHRYQKRYLGQILIERGLIEIHSFEKALTEFQSLKKRKLGEIIAQQTKIPYSLVEKHIQKAYDENPKDVKAGKILVEAGLVSEAQVSAALVVQEKFKKKRIGQFLIEKGLLEEDKIFMGLAEKFRMPFVDLRQVTFSKKALSQLPKDLVSKLQVLPISQDETTLVVATLAPDVPAIKDVLLKHVKGQKIELVLVRPTQLRAAIKKLYQDPA